MKFKFRLEAVYDLRQHLESDQKDTLARERQLLDAFYAEKNGLERQFADWSQRYLEQAKAGMRPEEAVRIGRYLDELSSCLLVAGRKIERQTENVERERLLLIEKMKDRKTVETLRDKQRERFIFDENKKEEQEIEELIASRR